MISPSVPGIENLTSSLLADSGVRRAMVIDDALDAGPERWADLSPDIQDSIRAEIDEHPELEKWLEREGLPLPDSAASPEAEHYLERLKERIGDRDDLFALWQGTIEPSLGTARKEVDDLIESLENLGLEVQPSGINDPQDPPEDVSVIFIDYTLDDSDRENVAAKSINEIKRIHRFLNARTKPIVVLMSSRTRLSEELKINFRNETGIMAGMFLGFQREDLSGTSLHLILNGIAENWPKAVALQSFVQTVTNASEAATDAVNSMVRNLTLEDFGLIQLLSLNADGHPLGEYLLWLIGAYFKQQLENREDVRLGQSDIDRLVFSAPPTTEWGPSDAFRSAYRAAVFAVADEDLSTARYPTLNEAAERLSGDPNKIVALHFGDVFVEAVDASTRAHLVVTPECDLAFGGSRAFPKNHGVVLVPGNMIPGRPFEMSGNDLPRTELLRWSGADWRVEWKIKEAEIIRLGEFKDMARSRSLKRVAKMEFSFAANVQRAYVGDITRIGLPVIPPQFQSRDVTVFVEDWDQQMQVVCGPIRDGAYVFSSPQYSERKCILSDRLVIELQSNIGKAMSLAKVTPTATDLERTPADQRGERQRRAVNRAKSNTAKLSDFSASANSILSLRGPHDLDISSGSNISTYVTITEAADINRSHAQTVLTIQLTMPGNAAPDNDVEDSP